MIKDKTLSLTERVLLPVNEGPPVCIRALTYSPRTAKVVDEALAVALRVIQEDVLSYQDWKKELERFGKEFRHVPPGLHKRLAMLFGPKEKAFLEQFEAWLCEAANIASRAVERNSELNRFAESFIAAGLQGPPPLYEDPLEQEAPIKISSGNYDHKAALESKETRVKSGTFGPKPDLGSQWDDLYGKSKFRKAEEALAEFLSIRKVRLRSLYKGLQLAADLERPGQAHKDAAEEILCYHIPLGTSPGIWSGKFEEILLSAAHGFIVPIAFAGGTQMALIISNHMSLNAEIVTMVTFGLGALRHFANTLLMIRRGLKGQPEVRSAVNPAPTLSQRDPITTRAHSDKPKSKPRQDKLRLGGTGGHGKRSRPSR